MLGNERLRHPSSPHIVPILEYHSAATRIQGFRELFEFGLKAPDPMMVVGDSAFREFLQSRQLSPSLEKEIRKTFDTIRTKNPNRGAYVGRAFYVPGINSPNGPRTAAIYDPDQYVQEIKNFYTFVLERGYDKVPQSDIALILHPFINVSDPRLRYGEMKLTEQLPWSGGNIIPYPVPGREHQIRIVAAYGPDEAIKSHPADTYDVDPQTQTITDKNIVLKDTTLLPGTGSTYDTFPIPLPMQQEQALTDQEILTVARVAHGILSRRPNARIEFIMQEDGPYVREIDIWDPIDEEDLIRLPNGTHITGAVIAIETEEDIKRIPPGDAIIYLGPKTFERRSTDLYATLAASRKTNQHLIALIHGTLVTSHQTRILSDHPKISIKLVGEKSYEEGTRLRIAKDTQGTTHIEYLDPFQDALISLSDVHKLQHGEAGQKVARLAIMKHYGLPVPDGFAISSQAIQRYFRELGISRLIANLDTVDMENDRELQSVTSTIQRRLLRKPFPPSFDTQLQGCIQHYGFSSYAIRSSGSEDGKDQSQAGLYESVINVPPHEVARKLKETIASYFSPASIRVIRAAGQLPSHMTVGVGIHEFIPEGKGSKGAVVFTYRNSIVIESTEGSPEQIVSGRATSHSKATIDRTTGEIVTENFGEKPKPLTTDQIMKIAQATVDIESIFRSYQDIELMVRGNGDIFIFQARPR